MSTGTRTALGGYQGSRAEYVRVPFGDVNCSTVPDGVTDTQALLVSDALATGYTGAVFCGIVEGDTVAVLGAGGAGLVAAASARALGAGRTIVVDRFPERLAVARAQGSEVVDYTEVGSVQEALREMTGGRGPDSVVEAVGMEAHGTGVQQVVDRAKQAVRASTDRATPLREALLACREGGTVSVLGIHGLTDSFPTAMVTNKGLTIRSAQRYGPVHAPAMFEHIQRGTIDPTPLATHTLPLEESVEGYRLLTEKEDGCIRAVFRP